MWDCLTQQKSLCSPYVMNIQNIWWWWWYMAKKQTMSVFRNIQCKMIDERAYLTAQQTADWLIFTRPHINLSPDIFIIFFFFLCCINIAKPFCPLGELISKLTEALANLRTGRVKQLLRFTLKVQCSPETDDQHTVLPMASRASVFCFFFVIKITKNKWN